MGNNLYRMFLSLADFTDYTDLYAMCNLSDLEDFYVKKIINLDKAEMIK